MKSTKHVTETAILLVLYMVLFTIVYFIPFLGIFFVWVLPLPFIMNAVRNGRNATIYMFVIALVLSLLFSLPAVLITLMFASVGVIVGEVYRRKGAAFHILLAGTLTFIVNFLLLYVLVVVFLGIDPITELVSGMKDTIKQMQQLSPEQFAGNEKLLAAFFKQLDLLTYIVPSMLLISAFIFALITQLIANLFLKRFNFEIQAWKPFHEWSLPKSLLFYYLIVLFLVLIGLEEGSTLYVIVMNLQLLLEIAMILQGFTVIFAFSKIKGWSLAIPIVIVVGSFLLTIPLQFVKLLGIIDLGIDLRSRMKS
ncbi:YybS family protein [Pueribacillus theae]|uniref:YybS family protein n=1 Tax=Pueribacillus theae TaxID=2171751 RepID=UPI0014023A61|nr:YybS family protein [Pueribacillus theae]